MFCPVNPPPLSFYFLQQFNQSPHSAPPYSLTSTMRGAIHVKCTRTHRGKQTDTDHPICEGVRFFTLFRVIKLQHFFKGL